MNAPGPTRRVLRAARIPLLVVFVLGLLAIGPLYRKSSKALRLLRESGVTGLIDRVAGNPNVKWATVAPEEAGMSSDLLDDLCRELIDNHNTRALLVARGGAIVQECYSDSGDPNRRFGTAALAKAVIASPALLVALEDGRLELDDPASDFIPQWRDDPVRSRITIRQLASHTSGIENVRFSLPNEGWRKEYVDDSSSRFAFALTHSPVNFEPGTQRDYSGTAFYPLAYALTVSLQGAPQEDLKSLLQQRIMAPLGIPPDAWSINYGRADELDGMTLFALGSGATLTARAMGRVGQLMLNRGTWEGNRIFAGELVDEFIRKDGSRGKIEIAPNAAASLGWWLNLDGRWPSVPPDAYAGLGAGHQFVMVIPSLDMVVVRTGKNLEGEDVLLIGEALEHRLLAPLMAAVHPAPDR